MMHYKTHGTCSTAIDLEIEGGKITSCRFTNGCRGNTDGPVFLRDLNIR